MSSYNFPQVVPHLVEDINLKRARVETEEGDAIRVTGINCGDKVTITPTLSEGTKIADFTINNVDGELYAPEAPTPPVTEVSITPSVVTGTKIADFSINNVAGELYAPASQGVGEAYPGSTGGEIFNYYGTDSDANQAIGDYSTVKGKKNVTRGDCSFVAGYNNTCSTSSPSAHTGGVVLGYNNRCETITGSTMGICIGHDNNFFQAQGQICIGANNLMSNAVKTDAIVIGYYNEGVKNGVTVGAYALTTPALGTNSTKFEVGCGTSVTQRRNALECSAANSSLTGNSNPIVYINHNFGLSNANSTTKAFVNAIIPPLDPDNITQDDKTLVTKSHLGATLPMTHLSGAITGLDESSFPLDFTSYWAAARATDANMKISLRINGSCYSKSLYNCLAVDGSFECYRSSYDSGTQITTFSRYRFGWDYANKALNLTGSMSWEMSDAGAISNVTHGLTGLVITIYQIETY